jgi:hypothetical protein
MKNSNQLRFSRAFGLLATIVFVAMSSGGTLARTSQSAQVKKQADSPIVAKCRADLAKRLKLQARDIQVVEVQPMVWPDASLGLPEIGKMYTQVMTPGLRVILEARNTRYLYTTSTKAFKYGGPVDAWSCSMLYVQPVHDEPNLNGDLYQCSLLGTNAVRLATGVSDYYPQDKGAVIVKRRTSRSGHELLYVRADAPGKEKKLYGAFDFGDAAFNDKQDQWAGFVRSGLGNVWTVVVGKIGQDASKARSLPLPDGYRPGKIAWSGETLMILVSKSAYPVAFETSPKAGMSEWKSTPGYNFPDYNKFMLDKSETLEVNQMTDGGKPSVEVALVWFTGTRNVVATISDFTLRGYDLLGPYAFVWGDRGSAPGAYAVTIRSGVTVSCFPGSVQNIKPFPYPPAVKFFK